MEFSVMVRYLFSWSSLYILYCCTVLQQVSGQLSGDGVHLMVPPSCPENITTIIQTGDELDIGDVSLSEVFSNTLDFINRDTPYDEFYYNISGLYLMSEPVPTSGHINNVRAFGYLRPQDLTRLVNGNIERGTMLGGAVDFFLVPSVYAVVYRPDLQNTYTLLHGPEIIVHQLMVGVTRILHWPVEEGDRIGVLIPEMCDESNIPILCPAQVNLRVPANECLSALYYNNPSDDIEDLRNIEMDLFEEVLVGLNLDATIILGMNKENTRSGAVLAGVLTCAVLILLLVIAVICIVIIWRKKKASPSNQKENRNRPFSTTYEDMSLRIASQPRPRNGDGDGEEGEDDSDYEEEAYFEPAFVEEDLIFQLTTKLAVPEIPRENLS